MKKTGSNSQNRSKNKAHTSDAQRRRRRSHKSTKSFKYVKFEQDKLSLTRDNAQRSHSQFQEQRDKNFLKDRGSKNQKPNAQLKIIPLGGLDTIGKNMTVFECGSDMVLDDAGLMFPDDNQPGIDLILPDYTYVLEKANKLRGIVITHGHEDHTGCLPYLYKDLDKKVPIYGSKLTLGLIEGKFKEHHIKDAQLIEVKPGDVINLGCIKAEFFAVNHSIPAALGIFFRTPAGNVLHTGDFKLDQSPIDGIQTDFAAITRFSEEGVDLMMSDSTNAENPNFTPSESKVGDALHEIIAQATGKVIIASFASHIHRMQQICDAAVDANRKVVVTGRSMIQNTDIARKLGYLDLKDSDLVDAYELNDLPPEKIVVMCTGSQGEPLSALSRIAAGLHKTISIDEGDTVIISATPIPGNEKAVTHIINNLAKIGADVYDKSRALVHVSGHGSAEELKLMLSMARPKYLMPVHGEVSHLYAHAKLAPQTGLPQENVFICDNGECLILDRDGLRFDESVQSGVVYVDGLSVGDTSQNVLDDRATIGSQGFATVCVAIDKRKRNLCAPIVIEMRGITGGDDADVVKEIRQEFEGAIRHALKKNPDFLELRKVARDTLSSILWDRIKQRPMVIATILEI